MADLNERYDYHKSFSKQTIGDFLQYSWPGNVREMRNVIERLFIRSAADDIDAGEVRDFPANGCPPPVGIPAGDGRLPYRGSLKEVLALVEEQYIKQVLADCGGRVGEAARRLGIHRSVLYRKIHRRS